MNLLPQLNPPNLLYFLLVTIRFICIRPREESTAFFALLHSIDTGWDLALDRILEVPSVKARPMRLLYAFSEEQHDT